MKIIVLATVAAILLFTTNLNAIKYKDCKLGSSYSRYKFQIEDFGKYDSLVTKTTSLFGIQEKIDYLNKRLGIPINHTIYNWDIADLRAFRHYYGDTKYYAQFLQVAVDARIDAYNVKETVENLVKKQTDRITKEYKSLLDAAKNIDERKLVLAKEDSAKSKYNNPRYREEYAKFLLKTAEIARNVLRALHTSDSPEEFRDMILAVNAMPK